MHSNLLAKQKVKRENNEVQSIWAVKALCNFQIRFVGLFDKLARDVYRVILDEGAV